MGSGVTTLEKQSSSFLYSVKCTFRVAQQFLSKVFTLWSENICIQKEVHTQKGYIYNSSQLM